MKLGYLSNTLTESVLEKFGDPPRTTRALKPIEEQFLGLVDEAIVQTGFPISDREASAYSVFGPGEEGRGFNWKVYLELKKRGADPADDWEDSFEMSCPVLYVTLRFQPSISTVCIEADFKSHEISSHRDNVYWRSTYGTGPYPGDIKDLLENFISFLDTEVGINEV